MNPANNVNEFDADGLQYIWSGSSLKLAEECLYKYYLTKIEGWVSKKPSVHLLWGGWYAEAIERYHRLVWEGATHDEALRQTVKAALVATWVSDASLGDDGSETGTPWQSTDNVKTRSNLIRTIVWYLDEFKDDVLKPITLSDGTPAVEYVFTVELTDKILFRGRWDRVVEYSGGLYVQDQKSTKSSITPWWFEDFNLDDQMDGYVFAGKIVLKTPVQGVIIDGAQVAVGFSRFMRGFTVRSQAQLEEWYHDALWWIDLAREATRKKRFPMNKTSCGKYGGCVFREICSKSPEVRGNFLEGDFERRPGWKYPISTR